MDLFTKIDAGVNPLEVNAVPFEVETKEETEHPF